MPRGPIAGCLKVCAGYLDCLDLVASDGFLEKLQMGGGGSFSIQKFILQILDLYRGLIEGAFLDKLDLALRLKQGSAV